MNELLEILNEIDDTIDYETETGLIDDHLLDSFAIISLVSELEDAFGHLHRCGGDDAGEFQLCGQSVEDGGKTARGRIKNGLQDTGCRG